MALTHRKLSDIMKEFAGTVLREPQAVSSEAAHAALLLAHVAWNRSLGQPLRETQYRAVLEELERSNPELWSELAGNEPEQLIGTLIDLKQARYPQDDRVIHVCGMREGNVHVEWYEGADVRDAGRTAGEHLGRAFELIMSGDEEQAIRLLCEKSGLGREEIEWRVKELRKLMESRPNA